MSEVSKVVLPRDVAEAIESYVTEYGRETLIRGHCEIGEWSGEREALNKVDVMTLASALVNGYKVEKSPEDAVKEYFKKCEELRLESAGMEYRIYLAKSTAIKTTLYFLGIKIEGVNA